MKLYHGTNAKWLPNILRIGIEPRGSRRSRSNWKHVPHQSNRNCVYLTNSYAPYFAHNATDINEVVAIIEVDTDRMSEDNFYADEDFLEQVFRGRDGDDRSMSERTLSYRAKQFSYRWTDNPVYPLWWKASVAGLGTCSYRGTVPIEAITRIVTYPRKSNLHLMFTFDPTITLINQRIMGEYYQELTRKLFAGEFTRIEENCITALPPIEEWKCQILISTTTSTSSG